MNKENKEITEAIPYDGIEVGIDAIIIVKDEPIYDAPDISSSNIEIVETVQPIKNIASPHLENNEKSKNKSSKIVFIIIGLFILAGGIYFGIQKYSDVVEREKALQEKITQDSITTANAAKFAADSAIQAAALLAAAEQAQKQSCYFNQLSRLFDYEIKVFPTTNNTVSFLELNIIDKTNKNVFKSLSIKSYTSLDCNGRSYITGFNKDEEAMDGDYGFLIIQDFNFDGLEDIAVKIDMGNSGSHYNFYLQTANHDYISDIFLTDSISYFPNLDFKTRILNLSVKAGAGSYYEKSYQYDSIAGWKLLSDTLIEITN